MPSFIARYIILPLILAVIVISCETETLQALQGKQTYVKGESGAGHGQPQNAFDVNDIGGGNQAQGSTRVSGQLSGKEISLNLCSDPPRGQCDFYRECLESKFHCGPKGYPLGYGEKYCEKFVAGQDKLSPAGQKWMMDTMQCLQRVLVPDATESEADNRKPGELDHSDTKSARESTDTGSNNNKRCDALKQKAFDSHSECYLANGLCSLSGRDWVEIVEIIGIKTLFDSWAAIKETIEAAEGCI
ncbi:hypothetical protein JR316_0007672 [Psilocybe cubensis]|uniref:Uncharacterized protein n=2 Tax=Psilocybe cubensis TaxID=181762 RepID=A0ACB8GTY5_PSICU|nr:hypothetical protein JR316_0007672 [Psilocybe cubensis]KAH9479093.1 hypothetical protein JR316_0007672 [Psilocybe cubensis]